LPVRRRRECHEAARGCSAVAGTSVPTPLDRQALSGLDAVVLAALPFAVLELAASASDVGVVFTAYSLPSIALVLVRGVWSDRLPRQLVMLASDAAARAAALNVLNAAGPALLAVGGPLAAIVPAQFASGVASGFFTAVWATTLQEQIEPTLTRASALSIG
jgi:MFS family permease